MEEIDHRETSNCESWADVNSWTEQRSQQQLARIDACDMSICFQVLGARDLLLTKNLTTKTAKQRRMNEAFEIPLGSIGFSEQVRSRPVWAKKTPDLKIPSMKGGGLSSTKKSHLSSSHPSILQESWGRD